MPRVKKSAVPVSVSSEFEDESDVEIKDEVVSYNEDEGSQSDSDSAEEKHAESNSGEDEGTSSGSSEEMEAEPTRTEIRNQLSNLTFEELLALKEKLGTKEYNEAMFGSKHKSGLSGSSTKKQQKQIKRDNKNRPREMSSKVRVPAVRDIVPVQKKKIVSRDPRFAEDCGKLNEELWNTNYSFLRDIAKDEQKNLKQTFSRDKSLDETKKTKIKTFLQRLSNKEKTATKKAEEEEKRRAAKKERQEQVAQGKKPYYMKKSTKKYVELAQKYDELKAKGKIESYLKKKRAKNASRDKKILKF